MSDPNGWDLIETAPKDGSEFLAYDAASGKQDVAHCVQSGPCKGDIMAVQFDYEYLAEKDEFGGPDARITHWQPLPGPPDREYWSRRQALKDKKVDIE